LVVDVSGWRQEVEWRSMGFGCGGSTPLGEDVVEVRIVKRWKFTRRAVCGGADGAGSKVWCTWEWRQKM
jgi:hypothetical protein